MEIVLELNAFSLLWIPHNVCSEITDVFKSQSKLSKTENANKKKFAICYLYEERNFRLNENGNKNKRVESRNGLVNHNINLKLNDIKAVNFMR